MRLREHEGIMDGRSDILFVKPDALKVCEGYNVRDLSTATAREKLEELKVSIKEHGVQQPLKVRFDGTDIIIVQGHRRHQAVMELNAAHVESGGADGHFIQSVPIFAEAKGTKELDRDFDIKTSNSGEPLEPLEFANLIYRTIKQRGISEAEAAEGFAVSLEVIRRHLEMRGLLPDQVKEMVNDGTVSATTALNEVKTSGAVAATETLQAAKQQAESEGKKRVTKQTINKTKGNPPPRPRQTSMPLAVDNSKQRTINFIGEAARLGVLTNVKDKPDDELVLVPASLLKSARDLHLNVPTTSSVPPTATQAEAEPAREAMSPGIAPAPVVQIDLLPAFIELTKRAAHVLQVNRSDECPGGFWTPEFASAIRNAERLIVQHGINIDRDPFDKTFSAIEDLRIAAETVDAEA